MKTKIRNWLTLFFFPVVLMACQTGSGLADSDLSNGEIWQLRQGELAGETFQPQTQPITLTFTAEGLIAGSTGINQYSAPVELRGNQFTLPNPIRTTRRAGTVELMRTENAYLSTLREINQYQRNGNQLTLSGDNGAVLIYNAQ